MIETLSKIYRTYYLCLLVFNGINIISSIFDKSTIECSSHIDIINDCIKKCNDKHKNISFHKNIFIINILRFRFISKGFNYSISLQNKDENFAEGEKNTFLENHRSLAIEFEPPLEYANPEY